VPTVSLSVVSVLSVLSGDADPGFQHEISAQPRLLRDAPDSPDSPESTSQIEQEKLPIAHELVETELFAPTYRSYGLATVRYPVLEVTATVEPFENGCGFSLRVHRAGKPRSLPTG